MKSGKIRTTDVYVTKRVSWPHEMVTTAHGQPPIYLDMSLALFTNEYLCVAAAESGPVREYMLEHLQELMEDVESYGWKVVRNSNAVWLQLLEQGRVVWDDGPRKEKLCRLLVWNKPALAFKQTPASTADHSPAPAVQEPLRLPSTASQAGG